MIKVFCDVCEQIIEEDLQKCSSNKEAFQGIYTYCDGLGKFDFTVSIDMTGNGHANDVCRGCVSKMIRDMERYDGIDTD